MNNELKGKYYVKKGSNDNYTDITTMFDGVRVLSLDGFNEVGEAVNVFTQQWVDSQAEDFMVTKQVTNNNTTTDVVIRKNVDLSMTIIVSRRYASTTIDEQSVFNTLRDYFCNHGDFYIKSLYTNMQAHVVCLSGFKPTTQKLNRNEKSYIIATIPLHCLDMAGTIIT